MPQSVEKHIPWQETTTEPSKSSGAASMRRIRFTTAGFFALGLGEFDAAHMTYADLALRLKVRAETVQEFTI